MQQRTVERCKLQFATRVANYYGKEKESKEIKEVTPLVFWNIDLFRYPLEEKISQGVGDFFVVCEAPPWMGVYFFIQCGKVWR